MEKKIIQGVIGKKNPLAMVFLILSVTLFVVAVVFLFLEYLNGETYCGYGWGGDIWKDYTEVYDSFFAFFISYLIWGTDANIIWFFVICGAILALIAWKIVLLAMNRSTLVVTDRRVLGKGSWGLAVDLPLNQISSIGLGLFKTISISTSSGKVLFWLVENRDEVHEKLSELLVKVQSNDISRNAEISSADELKKYKELLESGVITQEEFDAKKKQILGL